MKNVHKLTEGAILLAVFTVLLLLTIYVPVIGVITNLALPLPFILFSAKNDWKSTLVFVIASLLLSFITGTIMALPLTLAFGLTGAIMGYQIQKDKSRTVILISGSLVFLINLVLQYIISVSFFHYNIIDEAIKILRDSLTMSTNMMGKMQGSQKIIDQFKEALDLMKTLVPSLFVMSSLFIVFFIQLISLPIIKRFGIKVENWKPFRELSLPKSLIWYFLLAMLANYLLHPQSGTYFNNALVNITYILELFMFFQGLTFIFYFFYQRGVKNSIPLFISIFSLFIPSLLYIIGILGIIDLGMDLRSRIK